ncbi:MAG: hypothetical protein RRA92_11055, partial [Gemmatimonadota bacterium]|nr:hypothetical protein [Gemmatimonadota bacterium]
DIVLPGLGLPAWTMNLVLLLAWLDKAVEFGDPGLSEILVQHLFANVRDDPRWLPFLESIGKSPEQMAAIEFEVSVPQ